MTPQDQKAHFDDQGYLILEGILTPEEVLECQEEVKRLHDVAATLKEAGDPDGGHFQIEPYAGDESQEDGRLVLRKIESTRKFSDVFRRLSEHPKLVAAIQNLIGPDLLPDQVPPPRGKGVPVLVRGHGHQGSELLGIGLPRLEAKALQPAHPVTVMDRSIGPLLLFVVRPAVLHLEV